MQGCLQRDGFRASRHGGVTADAAVSTAKALPVPSRRPAVARLATSYAGRMRDFGDSRKGRPSSMSLLRDQSLCMVVAGLKMGRLLHDWVGVPYTSVEVWRYCLPPLNVFSQRAISSFRHCCQWPAILITKMTALYLRASVQWVETAIHSPRHDEPTGNANPFLLCCCGKLLCNCIIIGRMQPAFDEHPLTVFTWLTYWRITTLMGGFLR